MAYNQVRDVVRNSQPPVDASFISGGAFIPGDREYAYSIDNPWGDATICICDLKTGAVRMEFASSAGHVTLAVSPDGKWLATGGATPLIEIRDLKQKKVTRQFDGNQERIWCLSFSPDSRFLASGGDDGSVIVWDVARRTRR